MAVAILGMSASLATAQQISSINASEYDAYYSQGAEQPASPSDVAPSPKDVPPAPMPADAAAPAAAGGAGGGADCGNGCCEADCGCRKCCDSFCGVERCCELECCDAAAFRLFDDVCGLQCRGIKIYGWISGGFTANEYDPVDSYNGPVTFNDRANEGQLNQAYLVIEDAIANEGCGWDFGGRVDVL
jgi:hypothetical protein